MTLDFHLASTIRILNSCCFNICRGRREECTKKKTKFILKLIQIQFTCPLFCLNKALSLSFRKCYLHLTENLVNLIWLRCETKVIASPCILEITSFYSNCFSKQPIKAACSGWNTTGLNIRLLFEKYTHLQMPMTSTWASPITQKVTSYLVSKWGIST